jgi:hypothetical protein
MEKVESVVSSAENAGGGGELAGGAMVECFFRSVFRQCVILKSILDFSGLFNKLNKKN